MAESASSAARQRRKIRVMADFLLEIGLEEVPARMIAGAEAELGKRVNDLLTRERLLAEGAKVTTYSTPRRLAVLVEGVLARQADTEEKLTGPVVEGRVQGRRADAGGRGLCEEGGRGRCRARRKLTTPKGEYVGATVKRTGRTAAEIACRRAAEGSAGDLLGQEHVLARGQAGAVCAAGALGGGAAGFGGRAAGDCWDRGGQCEPRASRAAWRQRRW